MKLIQARVRGLGTLAESRWFDLSPHLNLFQFPNQDHGRSFLRILQTINPTYQCQTVKPFADFPKLTEQRGYTRRINPAKRTVALAVFSATPNLVKELAAISPLLYETDRIEVGRRLDYSRWINFVEISSSTRWSEIVGNVQVLLNQAHRLAPDLADRASDIIASLKPADRIKKELQRQLIDWLDNLPTDLRQSSRQLIESTRTSVMRAEYFLAARAIIRNRLPLFVVLGSTDLVADPHARETNPSGHLESSALDNLLHMITDRIKSLDEDSSRDGATFLDDLNEQLAVLPFSHMVLRLARSSTGVRLMINDKPLHQLSDGLLSSLRQMQAKAWLAVAFSRVMYKSEPIILFDGPERALPTAVHGDLADLMFNISNICQCLYSFSEVDIFRDSVAGRRYSAADLNITGVQRDRSEAMPMDGHV